MNHMPAGGVRLVCGVLLILVAFLLAVGVPIVHAEAIIAGPAGVGLLT